MTRKVDGGEADRELLDAIRRLAFDGSLDPADAMRRIRDAFRDAGRVVES